VSSTYYQDDVAPSAKAFTAYIMVVPVGKTFGHDGDFILLDWVTATEGERFIHQLAPAPFQWGR
jgi:hypothetical protein